ncbi:hypothetical protein [Streptomyces auratus]|uniref:Uncharacterized protein n=1 Tax=Streptomyces auratus AGR0001 TaxID=1160718 RepID=A0A8B1NSL2_9ACTN|nr:hypothetical protein [Streptomyces auratus]QTZ93827.1 hypothetical protein SU9_022250 [Streptomyces auratus AGR0001]
MANSRRRLSGALGQLPDMMPSRFAGARHRSDAGGPVNDGSAMPAEIASITAAA